MSSDFRGPRPLPVDRQERRRIVRHQKKTAGRPTSDHAIWNGISVVATEGPEGFGVFSVAEIVLCTFVGPRPTPTSVACHRDGDAHNCAADNLLWTEPQTAPAHSSMLVGAVGAAGTAVAVGMAVVGLATHGFM